MARITKRIIGAIGGSIGDIVIKYRNGKPYAASKPETTNTGTDPVTIYKKNQGRFAGKLAKAIYDNENFKKVWTDFTEKKDQVYNNIFSVYYRTLRNDDLSGSFSLTPLEGFKLSNALIEAGNGGIKISAGPIGENSGINAEVEKKLTAAGVIILKRGDCNSASNLDFIKLQFKKVELDLVNPVELIYNFADVEKTLFGNFELRRVYICLITLDGNNVPVNFSETVMGEEK